MIALLPHPQIRASQDFSGRYLTFAPTLQATASRSMSSGLSIPSDRSNRSGAE
jgi:hypothetical protein